MYCNLVTGKRRNVETPKWNRGSLDLKVHYFTEWAKGLSPDELPWIFNPAPPLAGIFTCQFQGHIIIIDISGNQNSFPCQQICNTVTWEQFSWSIKRYACWYIRKQVTAWLKHRRNIPPCSWETVLILCHICIIIIASSSLRVQVDFVGTVDLGTGRSGYELTRKQM